MTTFVRPVLVFGLAGVVLGVAACGQAPAATGGGPASTPTSHLSASTAPKETASFRLSTLASLTNYAFTYRVHEGAANALWTGTVHTLTDWKTTVGTETMYDINGKGFSIVHGFSTTVPQTFATPGGAHHLNGEYEAAIQWIGMTHVAGVKISKAGNCSVASIAGTLYDLSTPTAGAKILALGDQACIANTSGALLALVQSVKGGSAPDVLHLTGASTAFAVTEVNGVPAVTAPHP